MVFQQIANSLCTRQIRTKGVDEMELYWTYFGYQDDTPARTEHRLVQSNLAGPGGYISMEDGEAVELVHKTSANALDAHARVEVGGTGEKVFDILGRLDRMESRHGHPIQVSYPAAAPNRRD